MTAEGNDDDDDDDGCPFNVGVRVRNATDGTDGGAESLKSIFQRECGSYCWCAVEVLM